MPDHWYLLLWPRHDGELSKVLWWITVTYRMLACPSEDRGCRAFLGQTDEHVLTIAR